MPTENIDTLPVEWAIADKCGAYCLWLLWIGCLAVLAVAPVKSFAYHHLCKMYSDYITPHCMFSIYAKAHEHQLGSKKPSQRILLMDNENFKRPKFFFCFWNWHLEDGRSSCELLTVSMFIGLLPDTGKVNVCYLLIFADHTLLEQWAMKLGAIKEVDDTVNDKYGDRSPKPTVGLALQRYGERLYAGTLLISKDSHDPVSACAEFPFDDLHAEGNFRHSMDGRNLQAPQF
ncbi:hypothetical protein AXG93_2508s1040 [Marchantia polymorpha subsp. ruderalis]|uniref:Uncharacterized protein n=1 Tax=Marchantia polymorpha subsp. ruderalis TaxID=1480154 RepID=A0A176WEW7_MARPO|nr:hypothetical protein AXG93_2508s1040 [Marchantia polymorpha subsp. ruderalis]